MNLKAKGHLNASTKMTSFMLSWQEKVPAGGESWRGKGPLSYHFNQP